MRKNHQSMTIEWGIKQLKDIISHLKTKQTKEIKAIKENFNNSSHNFHGGQFYEEFNNICKIEDKLGFTKQHWEQYTKDKQGLTPVVRNFIEASLKMFDLKHYLIK